MIVSIDDRYACALREPCDFKSFKVVVDHPPAAAQAVGHALVDIGGALQDPYAWIPIDWIGHQPGLLDDAAWQSELQGMLAYATRKGWVDEARGWVRAHIEWREMSD